MRAHYLFALLAVATLGADGELINTKCPVMTDQDAVDDYNIEHRGRKVRFCCSECRTEFRNNPEKYEAALEIAAESNWQRGRSFYRKHTRFSCILLLLASLITLRGYRAIRRKTAADRLMERLLFQPCRATVPLILMLAIVGYYFWGLAVRNYNTQLQEDIHYATFYDFGFPAQPKHPGTEPRVAASFYRGNDERNPRLFNNGNYRTATFHVSLVDAAGAQVTHGDQIQNRQLFVELKIERPPFTPDFLYSPQFMSTMFLSAKCERQLGADGPVIDRVNLTETQTMQEWTARYPVSFEQPSANGVVYVCEEYHYEPWYLPGTPKRGGSRYHYAIKYELNAESGNLSDTSDIWMGALYRTRKFRQATVPLDQWFSHNPIPELREENTTDPDLLGISDYTD